MTLKKILTMILNILYIFTVVVLIIVAFNLMSDAYNLTIFLSGVIILFNVLFSLYNIYIKNHMNKYIKKDTINENIN